MDDSPKYTRYSRTEITVSMYCTSKSQLVSVLILVCQGTLSADEFGAFRLRKGINRGVGIERELSRILHRRLIQEILFVDRILHVNFIALKSNVTFCLKNVNGLKCDFSYFVESRSSNGDDYAGFFACEAAENDNLIN